MQFLLLPLAFVCEFLDSTLGMGYGTTLAPLLLLMGYEPLQVVPALLFSEFVTGITAAHFHHNTGNVDFGQGSEDRKVAIVLSVLTLVGVFIAVHLGLTLPSIYIKAAIGIIVLAMGVIIMLSLTLKPKFSWVKIGTLGVVAAFNKGISGGGYGPMVVGGQLLSGVKVKSAVGITSLAEGFACFLAIIFYFTMRPDIDLQLVPWLMAGAILSVPFSAYTLRWLPEKIAKEIMAVIIILLGLLTLWKLWL